MKRFREDIEGERDLEVNDKSGETFSRFLLSYIDHIFSENT